MITVDDIEWAEPRLENMSDEEIVRHTDGLIAEDGPVVAVRYLAKVSDAFFRNGEKQRGCDFAIMAAVVARASIRAFLVSHEKPKSTSEAYAVAIAHTLWETTLEPVEEVMERRDQVLLQRYLRDVCMLRRSPRKTPSRCTMTARKIRVLRGQIEKLTALYKKEFL